MLKEYRLEELEEIAGEILKKYGHKKIFAMCGELGSGKTTFTKEFCKQLGVTENVISPTFILHREYVGKKGKVHHIDLYRIETETELAELGLDTLDGMLLIEWADRFKQQIEQFSDADNIVWIQFAHVNETVRSIS